MATNAASRRLQKEYRSISANPPEYIVAHPSESNILEWHYIITGPPNTPYAGGQYWGTLIFPPDYPFAPPAIRMHTPSGRFQPSTRLCLSISDFHPKSFNPAWEVSTIIVGLLSFMTSEEMTTGSVRASEQERKLFAARSRWWNSTGGGTGSRSTTTTSTTTNSSTAGATSGSNARGNGAIKAGDGGQKFRTEWADLDEENWRYMQERKIDAATGNVLTPPSATPQASCTPGADALRKRVVAPGSGASAVMGGAQNARDAGQGWLRRNRFKVVLAVIFSYVLVARILGHTGVGGEGKGAAA